MANGLGYKVYAPWPDTLAKSKTKPASSDAFAGQRRRFGFVRDLNLIPELEFFETLIQTSWHRTEVGPWGYWSIAPLDTIKGPSPPEKLPIHQSFRNREENSWKE